MSRRTKKRRAERRARQAREATQPVAPQPELVDWDRIQRRYGSMRGRSVTLSYVQYGPRVEAKNPEELAANTAIEIARLMRNEPQS